MKKFLTYFYVHFTNKLTSFWAFLYCGIDKERSHITGEEYILLI
jgi:hypothetical protein